MHIAVSLLTPQTRIRSTLERMLFGPIRPCPPLLPPSVNICMLVPVAIAQLTRIAFTAQSLHKRSFAIPWADIGLMIMRLHGYGHLGEAAFWAAIQLIVVLWAFEVGMFVRMKRILLIICCEFNTKDDETRQRKNDVREGEIVVRLLYHRDVCRNTK